MKDGRTERRRDRKTEGQLIDVALVAFGFLHRLDVVGGVRFGHVSFGGDDFVEGGVDVFVNSTIDAWYGFSAEPWEHLALAQIRAVEHRVPIVRSVSTGVSAIINHLKQLQTHIPSQPITLNNLKK